ncbi:MAG: Ig-like domain-containing protein [Ruminococcus sp.]|nr:Ig-like domain-containing protein [Ruminococcus sp.]
MNFRKILAAAAVLCIISGAYVPQYDNAGIPDVYAEDSSDPSKITMAKVGDKYKVSVGGTTATPEWYSDNEEVAVVSSTGGLSAEITAVGKGTTAVYAKLAGQLLRFDVTVLGESEDEQLVVEVGSFTLTNMQNSATASLTGVDNSKATWSSSDESVAVVDSKGEVRAVGKGTCVISAVYGNVKYVINITSEYDPEQKPALPTESCIGTIALSDAIPSRHIELSSIPEGAAVKLSSTDESIAVVSQDGTVTAKGSGNCRIYIDVDGMISSYIEISSTYTGESSGNNVINAGSISLSAASASKQLSLKNIEAGAKIIWSSSDKNIAYVNEKGMVFAVSDGKCVINAQVGDITYAIDITVDMSDIDSLPETEIDGIGKSVTLQIPFSDAKFTSSDTSVVTVNEKGVVTSVGAGTAVVVAQSDSGISYIRFKVVADGLKGDANCDGEVSVADATLVLQYCGNKDKYTLSDTGMLNADVDGEAGISAKDALIIQMFDAGVINTLPYISK